MGPEKHWISDLLTIAAIFAAMTALAAIEGIVPLRAQARRRDGRLATNLGLTITTLAGNALLGAGLTFALHALPTRRFGPVVGIVALDFSTYLAHVAMHKVPILWRVHRVHHADPCVDVTTSLRQHPLEPFVRFAFLAPVACLLGVGAGTFLLYRTASVACGLLEHANVRIPRRLARALELVTTFPDLHKLHHSRDPAEADTNYGNLFSWFDRLFSTFTPSDRVRDVRYGLDARVPST